MRRFAVPLAVFVLANGALVLFDQYRLSQMKSRIATLESERSDLQREVDAQRLELQSVANDLCATELLKMQAEREIRDLRRAGESDPVFPSPAIDTKVISWSKKAGILVLGKGSDIGCKPGMKFTIYRGDTFVATALVEDAGRRFALAKIQLENKEPAVGDDASNNVLMSSTRPPNKEGK